MSVRGTLYVISAPSGGGKTSLVKALVQQTPDLCVSISHTTRAPRAGEAEGVNYFFVDEPHFKQCQEQGLFLEYAKVFSHWYGTSREWVLDALQAGKDVILEIDWQGARRIKEQMECLSIFILPPSLESLSTRLRERDQDSEAIIRERMSKASEEMSHYPEYDYVVVNDQFDSALSDLYAILRAQRLRTVAQQGRYGHVFDALLV
jgi:guanylate kinase